MIDGLETRLVVQTEMMFITGGKIIQLHLWHKEKNENRT